MKLKCRTREGSPNKMELFEAYSVCRIVCPFESIPPFSLRNKLLSVQACYTNSLSLFCFKSHGAFKSIYLQLRPQSRGFAISHRSFLPSHPTAPVSDSATQSCKLAASGQRRYFLPFLLSDSNTILPLFGRSNTSKALCYRSFIFLRVENLF